MFYGSHGKQIGDRSKAMILNQGKDKMEKKNSNLTYDSRFKYLSEESVDARTRKMLGVPTLPHHTHTVENPHITFGSPE